jgi:DNA methylase
VRLIQGDCREVLAGWEAESVDAVVTDPPYELNFMGQGWDRRGVAFNPATWREVLRVLKPGGFIVAAGGSRTFHRLACAIEDAGAEIRDCIGHVHGQGFPKHSSQLKPALEFWTVARKPLSEPTVAANVLRHGTGGLNVEAGRIGTEIVRSSGEGAARLNARRFAYGTRPQEYEAKQEPSFHAGRWPANFALVHSEECELRGERRVKGTNVPTLSGAAHSASGWGYGEKPAHHYADPDGLETVSDWACAPGCPVAELDAQSGVRTSGGKNGAVYATEKRGQVFGFADPRTSPAISDTGTASRFFYQAKASAAERSLLCRLCNGVYPAREREAHRHDRPDWAHVVQHPTQKPLGLLRWLVRLATPPGGLVCDPFCGTGTTGEACRLEGFAFTGIEQDADYLRIAAHRLGQQADRPRPAQLSLAFDFEEARR